MSSKAIDQAQLLWSPPGLFLILDHSCISAFSLFFFFFFFILFFQSIKKTKKNIVKSEITITVREVKNQNFLHVINDSHTVTWFFFPFYNLGFAPAPPQTCSGLSGLGQSETSVFVSEEHGGRGVFFEGVGRNQRVETYCFDVKRS